MKTIRIKDYYGIYQEIPVSDELYEGKRQTSPRIKGRHLKETVAHRDGGQLFCST